MRQARVVIGIAAWTVAALAACSGTGSAESAFSAAHDPGATDGGAAGGTDGGGLGDAFAVDEPDDDAALDDADTCGSVLLGAEAQPGNVVVVFDQSNSMRQPFEVTDAGVKTPKWQVARDALAAAVTPIAGKLRAGAVFFPTEPKPANGTCGLVDPITAATQIAIQDAAPFVGAWQAHFGGSWATILSTPLAAALAKADTALADPFPFSGPRVVVVMTDGAPTCVTDPATIVAPVTDMASRGIKTFVVGLPGSTTASALLDQIAVAGGSGAYLSPADPAALQAALAGIAQGAVDACTLTLSPPAPDPSKVYLYVTDAQTGVQTEEPATAGWSVSADGATASLTGALCDQAKTGAFSAIQFVFGCPLSGPH